MRLEVPGPLVSMELLARRLAEIRPLRGLERDLLLQYRHASRAYPAGAIIMHAGPGKQRLALIASGWAYRERILNNGRRQILSVLLPGDLIGNCGAQSPLDQVEIVAVNTVQLLSLTELVRCIDERPDAYRGLAEGFSALRFLEERRLIDHIVRLGTQPAVQRMAGFLEELFERCRTIGFVSAQSLVMPLTQEMMSDALGLSVVHVNRVIRQFKADRLIELHSGMLKILDPARLALAAGFEAPGFIGDASGQGLAA